MDGFGKRVLNTLLQNILRFSCFILFRKNAPSLMLAELLIRFYKIYKDLVKTILRHNKFQTIQWHNIFQGMPLNQ